MPTSSAVGRTAAVKRSTASSDSQTSMIWKPSSVSTNGRRRYSLFTGDVGTALCAAACLGVEARYPILIIDVLGVGGSRRALHRGGAADRRVARHRRPAGALPRPHLHLLAPPPTGADCTKCPSLGAST